MCARSRACTELKPPRDADAGQPALLIIIFRRRHSGRKLLFPGRLRLVFFFVSAGRTRRARCTRRNGRPSARPAGTRRGRFFSGRPPAKSSSFSIIYLSSPRTNESLISREPVRTAAAAVADEFSPRTRAYVRDERFFFHHDRR